MNMLNLWIIVCVIQVSRISGEVFVIKNPSEGTLECISEDDGNAMVWNDNTPYMNFTKSNPQFFNENGKGLERMMN